MTVLKLIEFLKQYDDECPVHMLQCESDNPISDYIGIKDAVGMNFYNDETYIVLIPE